VVFYMTHFIARFPQHSQPVPYPKSLDYIEAFGWYMRNHNYVQAQKFYRTYCRVTWARDKRLSDLIASGYGWL
jgi:hypothetical protein